MTLILHTSGIRVEFVGLLLSERGEIEIVIRYPDGGLLLQVVHPSTVSLSQERIS